MHDHDPNDVAVRIARGELDSFDRWMRSCVDRVYRLAMRMLGARSEAQDATQEVFLKAFQAVQLGKQPDVLGLDGWLTRIATNVCIDQLRARRGRAQSVGIDEISELVAPSSSDPDSLERALVVREQLAWLDVLPPEQRAVIVLRHLEGLSNAEVADVLQISEGAVEQRLIRARASLRKKIADEPT